MQKVTIYGAGAVGGHVAVRLAAAGHAEVSIVARGEHLAAIRSRGLTLLRDGSELHATFAHATDDPSVLAPQDLVIVALKAASLPEVAGALAALRAPGAPVLFLTNGIPWWWTHGLPPGHPAAQVSMDLLDPGGRLRTALGADAALGGVVYSPNEVVEPGVIRNRTRSRFALGEPDGSDSSRLAAVEALFAQAGIPTSRPDDIRRELLIKLVLNASSNTLGALTRLTTTSRLRDPALRDLARTLIHEVVAVATALGWPIGDDIDIEEHVDPARAKGLRPSMLQDVLAGRPMEVEALVGQLQVLARAAGVATPVMDVVVTLLRGLDRGVRESR